MGEWGGGTNQQPIIKQIEEGTWQWIGHTLRKPNRAALKSALD